MVGNIKLWVHTPSPSALRLMLKHCEEFAISRGLSFNASKTQLIRFGTQPSHLCPAIISFSGVSLPFTDTVAHLGHILSFDNSDTADILFKARDLVRKANLISMNSNYNADCTYIVLTC